MKLNKAELDLWRNEAELESAIKVFTLFGKEAISTPSMADHIALLTRSFHSVRSYRLALAGTTTFCEQYKATEAKRLGLPRKWDTAACAVMVAGVVLAFLFAAFMAL